MEGSIRFPLVCHPLLWQVTHHQFKKELFSVIIMRLYSAMLVLLIRLLHQPIIVLDVTKRSSFILRHCQDILHFLRHLLWGNFSAIQTSHQGITRSLSKGIQGLTLTKHGLVNLRDKFQLCAERMWKDSKSQTLDQLQRWKIFLWTGTLLPWRDQSWILYG